MIETRWWGERTETTLVLLHEGLGCIELWRDFPEKLAESTGYAAFAWSRPGYGRSAPCSLPRPLDYLQRAARMLPETLDAAGIGRCVLVGHSDGATIAALAAAGGDPRIAASILISPHYFVEPCCVEAVAAVRQAYLSGDLRRRLAKYHAHVDVAFHGWNLAWLDPGFRAWDIRAALSDIRTPVLQIQGREDPYATMAQPECLPGARLFVPEAQHSPHLEAPEAVLGEILHFLRAEL